MQNSPNPSKANASPFRQIFVARQVILDAEMNIFGYELLFRSGFVLEYDHLDGDDATRRVLADSYTQLGISGLTGGKPAFINFTENLLLSDVPMAFPNSSLFVEILESVVPTPELIQACLRLKKAKYQIVLDDFIYRESQRPFFDIADIIKIDFRITRGQERKTVIQLDPSKCYLAEKVETREEFEEAVALGYRLFQGHFFGKAVVVSGREIPSYKMAYLRLLHEIADPDLDFEKLERIIQQDVSLSYKLLHFINTAAFGFSRIRSIKQALTLLGLDQMRKWLSVVALVILAHDKPEVLTINSLVRARFCELLGMRSSVKSESAELFLVGLFSLIDALLDRPMAELLKELPLSEDVKDVLLGRENRFSFFLNAALQYEEAHWQEYQAIVEELGIPENEVPEMYFDSLVWARDAINGTGAG